MIRLGLGTAQFGSNYGITNAQGQVVPPVATAIVERAHTAGVRLFDTAALYGDSEGVLGDTLGPYSDVAIVTKTPKFGDLANVNLAVTRLKDSFSHSLSALKRPQVYGLLAHDAADLLGPLGAVLWDALEELKDAGRAKRIGASVYTGEQVDQLLEKLPLELVQVPINAVDHRLVRGGQLRRLAERGVEVHARSCFLQGLLLLDPERIEQRFAPLAERVRALNDLYRAKSLTPLEGSLAAVLRYPEISRIIIGVTSAAEFDAIIASYAKATIAGAEIDCARFAIDDAKIISPPLWQELGHQATSG
jgi:aryl-alcohol dehydrogenase-like predicted oxidoreductase